jgi:hypothetical protein
VRPAELVCGEIPDCNLRPVLALVTEVFRSFPKSLPEVVSLNRLPFKPLLTHSSKNYHFIRRRTTYAVETASLNAAACSLHQTAIPSVLQT